MDMRWIYRRGYSKLSGIADDRYAECVALRGGGGDDDSGKGAACIFSEKLSS